MEWLNKTEKNEHLEKYGENVLIIIITMGPFTETIIWGNKELEFDEHNIVLGDNKFNATSGLNELLLSKKPTNFTLTDH